MDMDFFYSEKFCFYRNAAAILGTFVLGRFVLRGLSGLFSGFRAFFLAPLGIGKLNLKKYGSWAVVTGASDGIGKAYALELANRGLNVVLMSRSEGKLDKVAAEIKEKFGTETLVIPVDFSDGFEIYEVIAEKIKDLDIGVLINNVGFVYNDLSELGNISSDLLYKVVHINGHPVVQMTRMLLPKMVKKGGGVIVNISSSASFWPIKNLVTYSATKVFVDYISEGVHKEYVEKGIIVQNVRPFLVATTMSGATKTSLFVPSANDFAKSALATVGVQRQTHGYLSHAIQAYFMSRIPNSVGDFLIDRQIKGEREIAQKQAKSKEN